MSLKKRAVFVGKQAEKKEDRRFATEEKREKRLLSENRGQLLHEKEKLIQITSKGIIDGKIRRNALQLKKEADEEQKELTDQEMMLETPAILRKK